MKKCKCGSQPVVHSNSVNSDRHQVKCESCGRHTAFYTSKTEYEAAWDKRAEK